MFRRLVAERIEAGDEGVELRERDCDGVALLVDYHDVAPVVHIGALPEDERQVLESNAGWRIMRHLFVLREEGVEFVETCAGVGHGFRCRGAFPDLGEKGVDLLIAGFDGETYVRLVHAHERERGRGR